MKIEAVRLKNFGSYKSLGFLFEDHGVTLIQGETGSGKSTLCDALPWILFGKTSKGGSVDEVISWNATGPTEGVISLASGISVVRTRGAKANDLFYTQDGLIKRGKDIPDTQRQINDLLGLTYDLYLAGAYYHEFSQTASFFTTTPKNRRTITEQLVDLTFPKQMSEKLTERRKGLKDANKQAEVCVKVRTAEVQALDSQIDMETSNRDSWQAKIEGKRHYLGVQLTNFDRVKADKIDTIAERITAKFSRMEPKKTKEEKALRKEIAALGPKKCDHCGNLIASTRKAELTKQLYQVESHNRNMAHLEAEIAHLEEQLLAANEEQNTYAEQLIALKGEQNPHVFTLQGLEKKSAKLDTLLEEAIELYSDTKQELDDVELLLDVLNSMRSNLIQTAISQLETNTNDLISEHFDGEIRVKFDSAAADKLDVTVTKDGNEAAYTQLSKGQRGILKLAFGMSVMKAVGNHHGIRFDQIFLDEALDGLDDNMKRKALQMLQTVALNHKAIYMVEHSADLKAMTDNRYIVRLVNGESEIEKAS